MLDFLYKWFGLRALKGLLDKLPQNGRKTAIGIILVVLSVLGALFPQYADMIQSAIVYLQANFEATPILTVGVITAAIGFLHKLLKAAEVLLEHAQEKSEEKE